MILKELKLKNFRNHVNNRFIFDDKNYITGLNGSGKTSILESISVLFAGRSFKVGSLKPLININADQFAIKSTFVNSEVSNQLTVEYNGKKKIFLNNKSLENIVHFYFEHPVIFYSPDNEGFLSKNQVDRRNFLDRMIFYTDLEHLIDLKNYNKLLELKKKYLEKGVKDPLIFDSLHEKITHLSNKIIDKRGRLVDRFNEYIAKYLSLIPSLNDEHFSLVYKADPINTELLNKEITLKMILSGPHRDKILFKLNNQPFDQIASYGQRKSLSLCCIYCFIKVVEDFSKKGIIILLDELESGLDTDRVLFFMELFDKYQCFITGQSQIISNINIIKLS